MTRLFRFALPVAVLAVTVFLALSTAFAQAPPPIPGDHYKVYEVVPKPTVGMPVFLRDQFDTLGVNTVATYLDRYANPVDKNQEGMRDSLLHYSWWRIDVPEPPRTVLVTNQFGLDQPFTTFDAVYLLNPSLKFAQPGMPLPIANHYKCYRAQGPPVAREVFLVDQWGPRTAFVEMPELLCNPTEKRIPGRQPEPIVDPNLHLVCYRIQPPLFYGMVAPTLDEFGFWDVRFDHDLLLCVPSLKDHAVPAEPNTWGRVKALYR